ncbi:MAG: three-Cys-motif partner protein TcmP [Alphaproteobacteria bacterium]|nr:three-Cys-motif partner protein TcmP [Alphaproteobacteria bacterium]MCW5742361.1 three-Cys-motif partner protein TcmP [Alphaproteobacteria bacterium]
MSTGSGLIDGDDGLPASEVGAWASQKHTYLNRYLDASRAARSKYLGAGKAGATFLDLFCGPGRGRVRETGKWIDGSAVAAWKMSLEGKAPFTKVLVADLDEDRRDACVERLRRLNAPVEELRGSAVEAAQTAARLLNPYGLHFAFIDPFNLGTLDFSIIRALAQLKRIDMLIHVSAMDLQRNLDANISAETSAFDAFAPGWRKEVNLRQSQAEVRRQVVEYWRSLVLQQGVWPATEMKLITGANNQRLYWLLLAAKHKLAHKLWSAAANIEKQPRLL